MNVERPHKKKEGNEGRRRNGRFGNRRLQKIRRGRSRIENIILQEKKKKRKGKRKEAGDHLK